MPAWTASWSWKAGTTAPDASTSTLRRPPDMSFTRLAKSLQNSWKISLFGQVDWNFQVAVWARETWGAATVAAAPRPATVRKRRRDCFDRSGAETSGDLAFNVTSL